MANKNSYLAFICLFEKETNNEISDNLPPERKINYLKKFLRWLSKQKYNILFLNKYAKTALQQINHFYSEYFKDIRKIEDEIKNLEIKANEKRLILQL